MNKKNIYLAIFTILIFFCLSIILFLIPQDSANAESKGNITVEITNFKNNNGDVLVGLYNNAKGFSSDPSSMIMRAKTTIKDNKSFVEFKDVPYGVYAVSGYQDANMNGKLDSGMFGIPKEGIITSNNAKGTFGPAKFDDAKFELKSAELKISIKVLYY